LGFQLQPPFAVLVNRGVHRIRREVQVTGPRDDPVVQANLSEQSGIRKSGKHPGASRWHQFGKIDRACQPIGKGNAQAQTWKGLDGCDTSR